MRLWTNYTKVRWALDAFSKSKLDWQLRLHSVKYYSMDKLELKKRIVRRILDMKKEMFEAVEDERYEEAAVLLVEIKRRQRGMLKKLLQKRV